MATTFLLDPRVLDDCVSDSAPNVEIIGEVVTYRKPRIGLPRYIFHVSDVDANLKPIIPHSLLGLFHQKREIRCYRTDLIDLRYQRACVAFVPDLSESSFLLPADFGDDEIVFCKGQFLEGDLKTLNNYGIKIL